MIHFDILNVVNRKNGNHKRLTIKARKFFFIVISLRLFNIRHTLLKFTLLYSRYYRGTYVYVHYVRTLSSSIVQKPVRTGYLGIQSKHIIKYTLCVMSLVLHFICT